MDSQTSEQMPAPLRFVLRVAAIYLCGCLVFYIAAAALGLIPWIQSGNHAVGGLFMSVISFLILPAFAPINALFADALADQLKYLLALLAFLATVVTGCIVFARSDRAPRS